MEPLTKPAIM